MLRVTSVAGRGKALLVVYALTARCQPAQFCTASLHVSVKPDRNSHNNGPQDARGAGGILNTIGDLSQDGSSIERDVSPSKGVKGTVDSLRGRNASASDTRSENKGIRRRAMEMVSQFVKGTKLLWSELVLAREASAKKKAGEILTFRESRLLRKVPRDLAKAFPLLAVFAVPFAGNLAPVVGFIFPKTLLPVQFWSSQQRLDFMIQDAIHQEISSFPKLLRQLAMLSSPPRPNSTLAQLCASARWFEEEGSLERLPRAHLMRLVKSCNTVSPLKKFAALFLPNAVLVALLRKEALSISNDDLALRRHQLLQTSEEDAQMRAFASTEHHTEFKLSPLEVAVLCWERGLLRSQHWSKGQVLLGVLESDGQGVEAEAMLESLQAWLSMYDDPSAISASSGDGPRPAGSSPSSVDGLPGALPPSMVLHASALLRLTFSAHDAAPVSHLRVPKAAR